MRAQFCSLEILWISWLSLLGSWNFDFTFWATLLFTCKTALLQLSYFLSLSSAYRSLRVQRSLHFVVSVSLSWNEYNPLWLLCSNFLQPSCSPSGSSVYWILQARILEWIAIPSSRGSFWPRDRTLVSCISDRFFTVWATGKSHSITVVPPN